jgi:signal transduction histidine kinase/ActR/RegA family two-component response regulator
VSESRGRQLETGHAERRVQQLSAFARGIICEFDGECRYRDVWTTDERLLAMPSQQLLGRTIVEALGEEIGRPLMDGTARVFATGTPETHVYTLPLAMGPRTFEARIVRIAAEGGPEPHRAAALIRDVTEEKQIERRLAEAERLAALGVLAAGIGHEINNPLMVVQENARLVSREIEALGQGAGVDSMRTKLVDVLDGVRRIQSIVADLRLFRRDDRQELLPVDPRASLESAIDLARGAVEQRAKLERDFGPVPLVVAGEAKLAQVFLNLLINATQAIPEGQAHSQHIRVSTRTDARGWAVVEVADTGCGIPAEELDRVFDPFFTTKREGMGLGLSICQRIVAGYGGSIAAESHPGRGTVFRIALPAAGADAARAAHERPEPSQARVRRMRLLVIDDEPRLLRVLTIALREEHDVVTADGCETALRILRDDASFDVILCDLMMPQGDGMIFYEKLRALNPDFNRRVVFMTGGAFTAQARAFLDSVPNRSLAKPFDPEALRSALTDAGLADAAARPGP